MPQRNQWAACCLLEAYRNLVLAPVTRLCATWINIMQTAPNRTRWIIQAHVASTSLHPAFCASCAMFQANQQAQLRALGLYGALALDKCIERFRMPGRHIVSIGIEIAKAELRKHARLHFAPMPFRQKFETLLTSAEILYWSSRSTLLKKRA